MRILAITHQYPTPAEPTFAPYNRQQFGVLARRHELRLIRPIAWPRVLADRVRGARVAEEIDERGIHVYRPAFRYPPRVLHHRYGTFFERSVAPTVDRVLATFSPDVLLTTWAHPDGWAVARLGRRLGLPVVLKVIGSDVLVLARGRREAFVRDALLGADGIAAVSADLARRVAELGVPAENIAIVPEGLDVAQFTPGDRADARHALGLTFDEPLILFVGNVRQAKGALDLVRACAALRERGVRFQCRLVGEPHERSLMERAIRDAGLAGRVTLAGSRPHGELRDWYRACDIVALPSHSEGIPNVLREGLSCGRPFVATRVGGIPEIAHDSYSRLVPPRDPRALADALADVLARPLRVEAERVGALNISWEESTARLESLIVRVADAQATRRTGRHLGATA